MGWPCHRQDGRPDILWDHQTTRELYVWLLDGVSLASGSYLSPSASSGPSWQIVPIPRLAPRTPQRPVRK